MATVLYTFKVQNANLSLDWGHFRLPEAIQGLLSKLSSIPSLDSFHDLASSSPRHETILQSIEHHMYLVTILMKLFKVQFGSMMASFRYHSF